MAAPSHSKESSSGRLSMQVQSLKVSVKHICFFQIALCKHFKSLRRKDSPFVWTSSLDHCLFYNLIYNVIYFLCVSLLNKVNIYLEYHSVCPLVRIGIPPTPPPRPQASVSPRNQRGRGHTRLRVRGPNSYGWRESWYSVYPTLMTSLHPYSEKALLVSYYLF